MRVREAMEKAVVSSGCGSGSVGPLAVPRRGDHSKTGNFRRERKQKRQHSGQQAGRPAVNRPGGAGARVVDTALGRSIGGDQVMGWVESSLFHHYLLLFGPFNNTMKTKNLKSSLSRAVVVEVILIR